MPDEELNGYIKELKHKESKREEQFRLLGPTVREAAEIKICPFCSEDIRVTAVKCKHCHSLLGPPKEKRDAVEEPFKNSSRYIGVTEELVVGMMVMGTAGIYWYLTESYISAYFALSVLFLFIIKWKDVKKKAESHGFSKFLHYSFVVLICHWTYKLLILLSEKYFNW